MKQLLRFLGVLAIILAVVFFLYGSIKMTRAEDQGPQTYDLGDDIRLVEEAPAKGRAEKGLLFAGVLLVAGIGLNLMAARSDR